MTKFSKLIAFILAAAMTLLLVTSCAKTPSDTAAFIALAEKNGYKVYDVTDQYANAPQITRATIVAPEDRSFQIEFYIITDKESAKKLYIAQSEELENYKRSEDKASVSNGSNYAKRSVVTDGKYLMVAYTENTVLYVPPTDANANKKTIEKFIKDFRY